MPMLLLLSIDPLPRNERRVYTSLTKYGLKIPPMGRPAGGSAVSAVAGPGFSDEP